VIVQLQEAPRNGQPPPALGCAADLQEWICNLDKGFRAILLWHAFVEVLRPMEELLLVLTGVEGR